MNGYSDIKAEMNSLYIKVICYYIDCIFIFKANPYNFLYLMSYLIN